MRTLKDEFSQNGVLSPTFEETAKSKETARNRHKSKNADHRITIRITADELDQLVVDSEGMSHSAHIRRCTFGNKASKRVVPEADRLLLAQILAKLGESRIANNLNQIAYHANCGSLVLDDVTIEEINEACLHVAWMRTQLIEALGLKDRERKSS